MDGTKTELHTSGSVGLPRVRSIPELPTQGEQHLPKVSAAASGELVVHLVVGVLALFIWASVSPFRELESQWRTLGIVVSVFVPLAWLAGVFVLMRQIRRADFAHSDVSRKLWVIPLGWSVLNLIALLLLLGHSAPG